ncbi:MAG: hypothetical protein Q9157_001299 [Trypethelium eluteriae]
MDLEYLSRHIDARVCNLAGILAAAAIFVAVCNTLYSYLRLRHIPGPRSAALSNLVRRSWVKTGDAHHIHTNLHRQYGPVVRYGPNAIMVSDPGAIEKIYGFKNRFEKSEFYDSIMPRIKGGKIPDVFATRDENVHRQMRRPVANLYSATNLTRFEPLMTSTLQYFFSRLDELYTDEKVELDLFKWIQLFMFDVLGEVTFSRALGCLEKGDDVEGVIEGIWLYFKKISANTQMPWLDYLWRDNPLVPVSTKRNPLAEFGMARIMERMSLTENEKLNIGEKDFLSCFIKEQAKDDTLPDIKEVDDAACEGRISKYATWKESRTLPYLEACVNEATRMNPPFALPFERVVPETGVEIDGYFIPPGARVGMSPWVVHREASLYGDDAEVWRPERWMCSEEKRTAMYNGLLTVSQIATTMTFPFRQLTFHFAQFGAGHRSCLGKQLAYFEIYKLIPSLLQRYDVSEPWVAYFVENLN